MDLPDDQWPLVLLLSQEVITYIHMACAASSTPTLTISLTPGSISIPLQVLMAMSDTWTACSVLPWFPLHFQLQSQTKSQISEWHTKVDYCPINKHPITRNALTIICACFVVWEWSSMNHKLLPASPCFGDSTSCLCFVDPTYFISITGAQTWALVGTVMCLANLRTALKISGHFHCIKAFMVQLLTSTPWPVPNLHCNHHHPIISTCWATVGTQCQTFRGLCSSICLHINNDGRNLT